MEKYMPVPIIKMLLEYWSDTVAVPDKVLPTVEHLTGRSARSLAEWEKDHACDFTKGG